MRSVISASLASRSTDDARRRFAELAQDLAQLQAKFEQNLMDATDEFQHHETDADALAGLPADVLDAAGAQPRRRISTGGCLRWILRPTSPFRHMPNLNPCDSYIMKRG